MARNVQELIDERNTLLHDLLEARARLAEVEAERDALRAALFGAHQDQETAEARLAEVEAHLRAASVLEIDFKVRDRIIAAARGEGDRG